MTEVHRLFTTASTYGPERLKVLGQAFDAAWEIIASGSPLAPSEVETTRTTLARVIVSLPCSETDDAERIKQAALQVLGLDCRDDRLQF